MKGKWTIFISMVAVVVLALAVGLTRAQGPEPPGEGVGPQEETGIAAALDDVIPIQGRLTDASGKSVPDGNYSITASIYNVSSGGTALCSDTDTVAVTNGLFNMSIDYCTSAHINGQQLYLGIKVGTDAEMTPRRAIYSVPYAWSLRPGAVISDTRDGILTVRSTGTGDGDALWAYAGGSGEAIEAYATDGVGIYALSENYLALQGYSHDNTNNPAIFGCSGSNAVCDPYRDDGAIGVMGVVSGTEGYGVAGFQTGYSTGDTGTYWKSGGLFGGRNGVIGISKEPGGYGVLGWNKATTGNTSIGVRGVTDSSTGWAGYFYTSAGNGVYISTPSGKTGLQVIGGSKSAVVRAEGGSRLLYTEESTEVWFTDYGFGKLQNGVAVIRIDPIFAQTVNLNEPYHVFVQPYGDASLYVTNRTPTGFEVRLHDGDPSVEFSYRIVAKRRGYESTRLERAPWADNDPNLYPEKRATWEAQQGGAP